MTDTSDSGPRDPSEHANCAACRSLDALDGVEDGHMFTPVIVAHIRNERWIVHRLLRAQDRVADQVTSFAGSLKFVWIHSIWFGIWIALNVGLLGSTIAFDKYPFGLLTMIVSLEAIFLSTFVMVSQNRQAARSDIRSQLDFETNLRSEVWSVHIGRKLGLDPVDVEAHVQRLVAQTRKGLDDGHAQDVDPSQI